MKHVFLFLFLLYSLSSVGQERTQKGPGDFLTKYISITYTGEANQPWASIVLSDDQSKVNAIHKTYNPMFSYLFIKETTYDALLKYIRSYSKYTNGKAKGINTYVITIADGGIKGYYFIKSGPDFAKYFNGIIGVAKKSKCDKNTISFLEARSRWLAG